MRFEPLAHQKISGEFLKTHNRAGLFLDMGLGKTVVTLTRVMELMDDFAVNKVLVIAPLRVAEDTWSRESVKWDHLAGLRISKVLGTAAQRHKAMAAPADIYVINRENVVWLIENYGKSWPFDMVVIDELSSFKSPSAKRWRALKRVIKLSPYVVGLTGTPAPNGYIDLWPQVYLLDGGERLGRTLGEFRSRYFNPGARKGHIVYEWKLKPGAKDAIDRVLSDLCISMKKEDWLKLPPIMYNTVTCRMSSSERKIYDQLKRDKVLPLLEGRLSDIENFDTAVIGGTAAVLRGKLLQLANGAVYDDHGEVMHVHDSKLDALEEIVEAAQGQNIMVFYSYKHDLERIKARFPQAEEIGGPESIARWNRGEIPMLLMHPASAGHGLNLQEGGHTAVWFGLTDSLELFQQAVARLYRMGQQHSVMVHLLLCEDTFDGAVWDSLNRKDAVQDALMEALKGYLNGSKTI